MVFSSMTFLLLFLPLLLLLYFTVPNAKWRNGVLLTASLIFYAWGEPVYVLGMLASTLVNYIAAVIISKSDSGVSKKAALFLGAGFSLALLIYFKYYGFFLSNISRLFGISIAVPDIELPIGISFYTFQILTYTIDVYNNKAPVQKSFAKLLLYVSCFPQLIAGPIVQYSDVADRLDEREIAVSDFTGGVKRFIVGLSKKVLLANICGAALEALPRAGGEAQLSVLSAWAAAFLYSLQLYFDFSAYSDMAIGLGKMLGFSYKENFDYPYISASATEFWRRWHISLGSFFREYVYIPLGGNRRGTGRTILNMMIVWALTGLWHGASWNFVLWGLYYGILLTLEKYTLRPILKSIPVAIRRILTFVIVVIGWNIFYYTDFKALGDSLLAMLGLVKQLDGGLGHAALYDADTVAVIKQYTVLPLIALLFSLPVVPLLKEKMLQAENGERYVSVSGNISVVVLFIVSLAFLVGQSYNPFIYFRF